MATVEKRGNSWRLVVFLGLDANKKQIRHKKTIPAAGISKTEAKRLANEFELELLKPSFFNDQDLTLSGFIDYWKEKYAYQEGNYSPTTLDRNENLLDRIIPALGHIRIKKLKPTHLMEFYNQLRQEPRRDGKGLLSSRTIQMHHKFLSSIMSKAKQWQFLELNPCEYVDAPKSKSGKMPIYEEDDLIKFLTLLSIHAKIKYQLFFLLAFSTGLRRGEILGLRRQDINMEKCILRVNQSAIVVKKVGVKYKDPKTDKSAAGVSFSKSILPILKAHLEEQDAMKELAGDKWTKTDLIFTTAVGKSMFPSTVNHWLIKFIDTHKLPHVSPHSFRHMSVTYAIDRGFDLKAVSERARHTQISTTADIYAHVLPQKDQAIAASLDEIIVQSQDIKVKKPSLTVKRRYVLRRSCPILCPK